MSRDCRWTEDNEGVWDADCGQAHIFTEGGPRANDYAYCPYCGAHMYEVPYENPDSDMLATHGFDANGDGPDFTD